MAWSDWQVGQFRQKVDKSLEHVKTLLHNARTPELPEGDHPHCYDDKYLLSVLLTNTALAAELNLLNFLGLSPENLRTLVRWARSETVTLRLKARHECQFVRMEKKRIEGPTETTTLGRIFRFSERTVVKQRIYIWRFSFRWQIVVFPGTREGDRIRLRTRKGSCEIVTHSEDPPMPEKVNVTPVDFDLSWLLQKVSKHGRTKFKINRTAATCHTPRRNADTDRALRHFQGLSSFSAGALAYFEANLFTNQPSSDIQLSLLREEPLPFVPIVPLFDFSQDTNGDDDNKNKNKNSPLPLSPRRPTGPAVVIHTSTSNLALSVPPIQGSPTSPSSLSQSSPSSAHKGSRSPRQHQSSSQLLPADGSGGGSVSPRGHRSPRQFLSSLVKSASSSQLKDSTGSVSSSVAEANEEAEAPPPSPPQEPTTTEAAVTASSSSTTVSAATTPRHGTRPIARLATDGHGRVLMPIADLELFLAEQRRTLDAKLGDVAAVFPPADHKAITVVEGQLVALFVHAQALAAAFDAGVNYIEQMLYAQLLQAIGHQLKPSDFTNYMRFHNTKLFDPNYRLKGFAYAVRRPDHTPEGIISIEAKLNDANPVSSPSLFSSAPVNAVAPPEGSAPQPILTSVRSFEDPLPMQFAIGAASHVPFYATKYLHAYMGFQFAGDSGSQMSFWARARQFSSFIVLLGRIHSPSVFAPEAALIVQNQDEVEIPLLFDFLPSAKQFRDATASLSPEQQQFAQAFRSMQLESTMFAVCVLEIKPQLERLLNLDPDALTQEIELTEDLLELFMKFQIPSDLLRYQGDQQASGSAKLAAVHANVARIRGTIELMRKQELQKRFEERLAREAARDAERAAAKKVVPRFHAAGIRLTRGSSFELSRNSEMLGGCDGGGSAAMDQMKISSDQQQQQQQRADPQEPAKPQDPQEKSDQQDADDQQAGALDRADADRQQLFDFSSIPEQLNDRFEQLDVDACVTPAIIRTNGVWTRKRKPTILSAQVQESLALAEQKDEQKKAFDLIDSLSRSGNLPFRDAALHVVLANAHQFGKSIIDTVVQDNANPIEKVERSLLIVTSVVHGVTPQTLIKEEELTRVQQVSPTLFS